MAEASKTIEMSVPRERLWDVIVDYARYSEFVDGVSKVKILSRDLKDVPQALALASKQL